jgi:YNFM family putative membrane transporter
MTADSHNTDQRISTGTPAYNRANLALFCAGFITFVTLYDIQPMLPLFTREFGVSPAVGSLPLSVSTATLALAMLVTGTLSETLGRKRVMVWALALTSLLAIATAFTNSFSSLLTVRLLQGLALAGVPSVAMAYLGEEMSGSAITPAMGLYISGNAVGGMTGRILTAFLTDHLHWRTAIGLMGLASLLLTLLFIKSLPPSRNFRQRSFRSAYLATSILGHLKDPGMLSLFGISFFCMGGFVSLYNYIGFRLLEAPYLLNQSAISLIFLVYFLGSLSSAMITRLVQRFGRPRVIRLTIAAMALGTLVTLLQPIHWIVAGVALFTCGFFGAHSIASSWVSRRAVTAKAQAASLYLFFYYLGSSISGTLGGVFWSSYSWPGVSLMIILLMAMAYLSAELLIRRFSEQTGQT